MLKATLAVIAVVGLVYGFWEAFSEQRRLSRAAAVRRDTSLTDGDSNAMARACEAGRGRQ